MIRLSLRCSVAALLIAAGAAAQTDTLRVEELPDPAALTPTERQATQPEAVSTPTHRPTHAATATVSATETVTDTPTLSPTDAPTATGTSVATSTRAQAATPTAAMTPTLAATATHTPVWLAAIGGAAISVDHPLLAPIAAALLVLLSTWFGARIAGGRERRERTRARRSLATAMLLELRRIDAVLRRVVTLDSPASFPSLDHPIMEGALRDLTLFDTEAAARIAQFHGALRGIQHEIGDYRDNPLRWAGRLSELNQLIKSRATATCRAVPELVKALERCGGNPPPALGESASSGSDPSRLPPPPFGASEGDDWTL